MSHLVFSLAAAVLIAAVLFGGGASLGASGDVIPQILSLALLYHVWVPGWRRLSEAPLFKVLLISLAGLFVIQLLPLPPALWTALPGRSVIRLMLEDAGATPGWLSLSLRPYETLKSSLTLLPPVAVFFAVVVMDLKRRIWLVGVLIVLVLLSVVVGLLQLLDGPGSAFYFHQFAARGRAVGFFANPNHYAALLYATLPLAAALMTGLSGRYMKIGAAAFGVILFAYLVGMSISGSRTALLLGSVSLLASVVMLAASGVLVALARGRLAFVAVGLVATIMPVLMGVGLLAILDRLESQDVFDDLRWKVLPAALAQAWSYFPFGAGLGAFEKAYALNESPALLTPAFVNHVHNDWIEAVYEAGALSLVPMAAGIMALAGRTWCAWRAPQSQSARLAAGGAIGAWLLVVHSLWDYPLRTEACLATLAILAALSLAPLQANVDSVVDAIPGLGRKHVKRRRKSRRSTDAETPAALG